MSKFRQFITFLYVFLNVGFLLGTLTLAIIVENVVTYIRDTGWLANHENSVVIAIILVFVIYSFLLSRWLTSLFFSLTRISKALFIVVLTASVLICLWYWLTPKNQPPEKNYITSKDGRFVAGPYPDEAKMLYLKRNGYTGIISLLSYYVIPFEPVLIEKEDKLAKEIGIPVNHFPMLPWITKNTDSINKITALAKDKNNFKYYVHCYYGRDRVSMFMRIVNNISPISNLEKSQSSPTSDLKITKTIRFERGNAIRIGNHAIFAPTPTEDEFLKFVVAIDNPYFDMPIRSVISIQEDSASISTEEEALKKYGINFYHVDIRDYPYDPVKILELARKIKSMPGPVLIYTFYAEPQGRPISLEGIITSYLTDLPAIPLNVFRKLHLSNGETEVIAPNIVFGPDPADTEYENYLYNLGIRSVAYIGNCHDTRFQKEQKKSRLGNLVLNCFLFSDPELKSTLSTGGPWYVYGPDSGVIEDTLEKQFKHSLSVFNISGHSP